MAKISFFPIKTYFHFNPIRISANDIVDFIFITCLFLSVPAVVVYAFFSDNKTLHIIAALITTFFSFFIFWLLFYAILWLFTKLFSKDKEKQESVPVFGCYPAFLLAIVFFLSITNYFDGGTFKPRFIDNNNLINNFYNNSSNNNSFHDDGIVNYNLDDSYLDDNAEVWTTSGGKCYHVSSECISLKRSSNIYSTTKEDAINDGLRPCHICTAK